MCAMSLSELPPAERHRRIAEAFTHRVRGTTDWDAPAPVDGWVARDVVAHLMTWLPGLLSTGAGVELPKGPAVADDPVSAWRVHAESVQALLDDPSVGAQAFDHPQAGSMPLAVAIDRLYTSDVFMHTWDLARATGQDDRLDDAMCAAMVEGMEPMAEFLYASGQYGPRVVVPDDSDAQTRLLGLIGRDPDWRP
jgi:uncharacterized protein (TIGR03086 family)